MAATQVKNVIFDLGGVLVDWNPRYLYRKLFKDEREMETFLRDVCNSEWNEQQDAGRPFKEAIELILKDHPEKEPYVRAYFDRWAEMLGGPIHGTVEILEELHRWKSHRLLALSNWSAETFPIAKRAYSFLGLFETVLLSGEEKLIKPDPRFFNLLKTRLGAEPEQSVFIDDVQKNIDAARALGFHTIHFKGPEKLRADLRERFGITLDEK